MIYPMVPFPVTLSDI